MPLSAEMLNTYYQRKVNNMDSVKKKNKIFEILEGSGIEYKADDGKIIIFCSKDINALENALTKIKRYYAKADCIDMQKVIKVCNGKEVIVSMTVTITLPKDKEQIIKQINGRKYSERYGEYTTEDGEVFYCEDFDTGIVSKEFCLGLLAYEESRLIGDAEYCEREISDVNRLLNVAEDKKERCALLKRREDYAAKLDNILSEIKKKRALIKKRLKEYLECED